MIASLLKQDISRLLERAGEAGTVPGRSALVGGAPRHACYGVRRESRDGKGRRIVERWTEAVPAAVRG